MQLTSILLAAVAASTAVAAPTLSLFGKKVPGYPAGFGKCMNDAQSAFIAKTFKSILTNPDRKAAVATATALLDDKYVERSDSINVLAGYPQGGITFDGKQAFIDGIKYAPALNMEDLDVWHDCEKIGWQWLVTGLGKNVSPVKGFNKFVIDVQSGYLKTNDLEFNSIAWGEDLGGTWTPPPSS